MWKVTWYNLVLGIYSYILNVSELHKKRQTHSKVWRGFDLLTSFSKHIFIISNIHSLNTALDTTRIGVKKVISTKANDYLNINIF